MLTRISHPLIKVISTFLLLFQVSNSVWQCNLPEDPCNSTKPPCKCIETYLLNTYDKITRYSTKKCSIKSEWLKVAEFSTDQNITENSAIELGLVQKPNDFNNDSLNNYEDWDAANDERSHQILLIMKLYFCEKGVNISDDSVKDNFIYDFNYTERNIERPFNSVPGKDVSYYQLTAYCSRGMENYFHIYFDVIKNITNDKEMAPLNHDLPNIDISDTPCEATESIELAKVLPGQQNIIINADSTQTMKTVDILTGIELPGIIAHKHKFPPENHKVINLVTKLKQKINMEKITNIEEEMKVHWWKHVFKWELANKNTYQPKEIIPPDDELGKIILYQLVAHCENITLRSSRMIESRVDKDVNCIDGYLPLNFGPKDDDNIVERCSPYRTKIPDVGDCEPFDYYIEMKEGPAENRATQFTITTYNGVTWKNRPELVDYTEEFRKENIHRKLQDKARILGKSTKTRYNWKNVHIPDDLLTAKHVEGISDNEVSKSEQRKYYKIVLGCGDFIYYTDIKHLRVTKIIDGKCVEGDEGWGCDEFDDNDNLFVPEVRDY